MKKKMKERDQRFPIILLMAILVVTFAIFLMFSIPAPITGAAVGEFFSGWPLIWLWLIFMTLIIGAIVLTSNKK